MAAVTVSYPIFMLLSAFANLFGIGGGSLISRLLGGGKEDEAGKVGTVSLWAAGTVILFYSLAVWIFGGGMLRVLGSGGQTLDFARKYLVWTVVIGGLPTVLESWFPLGGRGNTQTLFNDSTISAIAQAHGVSSAQVIIRWHLQAGNICIPGSSNEQHIIEDYDVWDFELTEEEIAQMTALEKDERFAD